MHAFQLRARTQGVSLGFSSDSTSNGFAPLPPRPPLSSQTDSGESVCAHLSKAQRIRGLHLTQEGRIHLWAAGRGKLRVNYYDAKDSPCTWFAQPASSLDPVPDLFVHSFGKGVLSGHRMMSIFDSLYE